MAEVVYRVLHEEVSVDELPASEPLRALILPPSSRTPAAKRGELIDRKPPKLP
jgi:hypothetical protein